MPRALVHRQNDREQNLGPYALRDSALATFARKVEQRMIEKGENQSELARRAEQRMPDGRRFGRDSVSRYVRGLAFPSPVQLEALAQALDVDRDELLPEPPPVGPDESIRSAFEFRDARGGRAWLWVDKVVPLGVALKVAALLADVEET